MTITQFQQAHGDWLKSILSDPKGQSLLNVLASLQPLFPTSEVPHLFAKGIGEREGFERCIKALIQLSSAPRVPTEIEQNYGVSEPRTPAGSPNGKLS